MPTFLICEKSLPTLAVKDNLPEGWLHGASPNGRFCQLQWFICLFGVLRRFQHCTGHITTGSWKGRGNQYI